MTQNSGPTGSAARAFGHGRNCSQPHASIPTSPRRPPLPWRTRIDPRRWSRSCSASASASCTRRPVRQRTTIIARTPPAVTVIALVAHDGHDLLDRGGVGGVARSLCCVMGGRCGGRAALWASDAHLPHQPEARRSRNLPRWDSGISVALHGRRRSGYRSRCETERLPEPDRVPRDDRRPSNAGALRRRWVRSRPVGEPDRVSREGSRLRHNRRRMRTMCVLMSRHGVT
jgi:hypothetical protein